ncbi:MAG: methyl-accepting chemotaxis protein [Rhodothermaceae bacterium]
MNEYAGSPAELTLESSINLELVERLKTKISEVVENLLALNASTEEEFLLAGSKLNDYKLRCKKLIEDSTELSNELSGEILMEKISGINEMSKEFLNQFKSNSEENKLSFKLMEEIEVQLGSVMSEIHGFKKIIKTLKTLGVATLIESARLGDDAAGFNALATDVESLADNIEEKSLQIDKETKQLLKLISDTIGNNISLGKQQEEKIRTIISELGTDLNVLEEKHNVRLNTVEHILTDSGNINNDVSQVVTSVQFHDITRQQIEHVIESLTKASDELSEITPETSMDDVNRILALARDISRLESAQLENSGQIFIEAVENIKTSLKDIQKSIGNISTEIGSFLSDSDDEGNNFLSEIAEGLKNVNLVLEESSSINNQVKASLIEVGETVKNLSHFLHLIEEIGEEVELLAINANIKAAHTGSEGAALGVIADSIQKLSSEAMNQTILVSKPLKKITNEARSLTSDGEAAEVRDKIEANIKTITVEMENALTTIQGINVSSSESMGGLNNDTDNLQRDINDLDENINIHNETATVVENCIQILNAVIDDCLSEIGEDHRVENKEILDKIVSSYTMLSERKIYSIINDDTDIQSEMDEGEYQMESEESGLGDNVELF